MLDHVHVAAAEVAVWDVEEDKENINESIAPSDPKYNEPHVSLSEKHLYEISVKYTYNKWWLICFYDKKCGFYNSAPFQIQ